MDRIVITVVGKDTVGIIARVSNYLYKHNINVLDITQTVSAGFFNMMMIVSSADMDQSYEELTAGMRNLAAEIGVDIRCQREEIFDMMHRI